MKSVFRPRLGEIGGHNTYFCVVGSSFLASIYKERRTIRCGQWETRLDNGCWPRLFHHRSYRQACCQQTERSRIWGYLAAGKSVGDKPRRYKRALPKQPLLCSSAASLRRENSGDATRNP